MHELITTAQVRGRVRPSRIYPGGAVEHLSSFSPNLVMFDWATVVATRLGFDTRDYQLRAIYMEFENVAAPGDPVSAPAFDRSGGIAYYNSLASDPDRDYLRVAALPFPITSNNEVTFPQGNVLQIFAQSAGTLGVHGKTFSDTVNSKVFGGALVGVRADGDASQDLIFSRFYFPVSEQQVKLPTSNIGITWELEFA